MFFAEGRAGKVMVNFIHGECVFCMRTYSISIKQINIKVNGDNMDGNIMQYSLMSLLLVFLLMPLCVSAAEDSPEEAVVVDIPVAQIAPSISFRIDTVSKLETNRPYAAGFSLATITLMMINNSGSVFDGGGMIAYRFTPSTDEQVENDANSTLVDAPGERGDPFTVTYANESYYVKNISVGNDTYHVNYIMQPASSDVSFNLVLGGRGKLFRYPGVFKVSLDYAVYYP